MRTNGILQLSPLFRVVVAMVLGMVTSAEWTGGVSPFSWFSFMLASVVVALALRRHALLQGLAIMVAVFFCGACLMSVKRDEGKVVFSGEEEIYGAVLLSEPMQRGKVVQFDMLLTTGHMARQRVRASLLRDTVDRNYQRLHVGDGIVAQSVMEPYAYRGTFSATTFIFWSNWRKSVIDLTGLSFFERTRLAALVFRQKLLQRVGTLGLDNDDFSVAVAMALGERRFISRELRDAYSVSGASHILALSGLHLGLIYMFLSLLLARRRFRLLGECLVLTAIWAYVLMVGMPPSVVRAAIMLTIYGVLGLAHRDRMSLNALSLAAIIMLVASPPLLYDVGFQLSFLSVAAIVLLYRPLSQLLPRRISCLPVVGWIWGMLVVSFCAQLGTIPLVMYYFGRVPCYGLLTNFVVIPLAYVILLLVLVLLAVSWWPLACSWLAKGLSLTVSLQNKVLWSIASLPGSSIDGISISRFQVVLLYVAIVCFSAVVVLLSNSLARKRGVL